MHNSTHVPVRLGGGRGALAAQMRKAKTVDIMSCDVKSGSACFSHHRRSNHNGFSKTYRAR
jgi:hypothetical protein